MKGLLGTYVQIVPVALRGSTFHCTFSVAAHPDVVRVADSPLEALQEQFINLSKAVGSLSSGVSTLQVHINLSQLRGLCHART